MKSLDEKTYWRIIAVIALVVWGFVTIGNLYLNLIPPYEFNEKNIIPSAKMAPLYISTLLGCVVLVVFPCQFYIYTFFCCAWGLFHLIEGGNLPGFLMYCLGLAFAMEKGFFATRRKLKLTLSAMVLVAALLSQIRYGGKILVNTIEGLVAVFLIVGIGAFLLRHRIQNIYKKHAETDAVASPLSSPAEPEAAASSLSLSVGTDVAASSLSPLAEPEAVSPLSSPAEPEAVGLPFSPPAKILTLPHDKFDSQDVVVI